MAKGGLILRKIKMFLIFSFLIAFSFNFTATEAYACSCAAPGSPTEELNMSTAVFSGKVIKIVDPNKDAEIQSSADLLEVQLKVKETWKGVDETIVTLYTARESASCGFNFTLNEEYLVYANKSDGALHVNLCSRTAPLIAATSDLEELGAGEEPTVIVEVDQSDGKKENIVAKSEDDHSNILLIFSILGLIIIAISLYAIIKKKRNQ
ncbi:hypothetical protein CD30_11645 [Ureibacillus massiliensis 4400831 = CIP 108448 = CCUG 49529]|uniref:Tissue inhibitor of metalloproteinase n=1 Tax=Ureibacillus massiliensis 4400831 = CIP 108448 = CCUG 49529 TaxID=1211035 RepID=A0A0A3J5L9_9BACL|nr:hypothetical protein CD30_11645 [Ureibacillus massiliensis 4400831 = CIP 108448 = CCUG 49529]